MASGSEDVISLELAEHVAVDIRRADAFSRTKREAAAGTETNSADDAVGIRNLSLDAALRFKPENRGIYTQSDSPKKSSRNIWSLAVVSVDQRY